MGFLRAQKQPLLCGVVVLMAACGRWHFEEKHIDAAGVSDASEAGSEADASMEAGTDASTDSSIEAGLDASIDAGSDAAADSGMDASVDASADATIDASADATIDASTGCTWTAWGAPEELTGFGISGIYWGSTLSADALTIYLAVNAGPEEQLFVATRPDRGTLFSPAVPLANVHGVGKDGTPSISADGLSLYFFSERAGGSGDRDVWVAQRASVLDDFGTPIPVAEVNTPGSEYLPHIGPDGLTLTFSSDRSGGAGAEDVWRATRATTADPFTNITNWGEINTSARDVGAVMSRDGLTVVFTSDRAGGLGGNDIWIATRSDTAAAFDPAVNLAVANTIDSDLDVTLSADDHEIIFSSLRNGSRTLWRVWRDCL